MIGVLSSSVGDIIIGSGLAVVLVAMAFAILRYGRWLKVKIGAMEAQFSNNGGSSLRDAIDRIEKRQESFEARLLGIEDIMTDPKEGH